MISNDEEKSNLNIKYDNCFIDFTDSNEIFYTPWKWIDGEWIKLPVKTLKVGEIK